MDHLDSQQPIMEKAGVHGKLPAHGDFVSRHLPPAFIAGWDGWLQRALPCSQELLGARWLDIYLTSPVWRFVLTAGVVDHQVWAGVLIPSVDRVGRYYPLTLAQAFAPTLLPTQLQVTQEDWFTDLEQAALAGLRDGVTIDHLEHWLNDIRMPHRQALEAGTQWLRPLEPGRPLALPLQTSGQNPLSACPALLHALLLQRFPSYSLWWSAGSERVGPVSLISGFLPSPQCFTALLAGDWEQRGWALPFTAVTPLPAAVLSENTPDPVHNQYKNE